MGSPPSCQKYYKLSINLSHSDLIRDIKDPEHPNSLEELNVVNEKGIDVEYRTSTNEVWDTSDVAHATSHQCE